MNVYFPRKVNKFMLWYKETEFTKEKQKVNESTGRIRLMGYAHAISLKELRQSSELALWNMSKLFWQI
jgi:hypothetical protein